MRLENQKFGLLLISLSLFLSFFISAQEQADVDGVDNLSANVVFLVRHFEKQTSDTLNKKLKDPELTQRGQTRAQALAVFLAEKNITSVFSTHYKRTLQTATPTAEQFGINIAFYNPSELANFAGQLKTLAGAGNGNILVVGHSNTTPQLLKLLGGPDKVLAEDDYGDLFYLALGDGERTVPRAFQQIMIE
jgi:phosphohistidine phosphatase SixA